VATDHAVAQAQQQSLAALLAPEARYELRAAPDLKKRTAVIGSAPQLSAEGLLAAARAAQQKDAQQRAQARRPGYVAWSGQACSVPCTCVLCELPCRQCAL
jgi:hypothetical protein